MNGEHRVNLTALDTVLTPQWGLTCIESATKHVLFGPEKYLTRSASLTALRDARFRVLSGMPRSVRDQRKEGV